MPTHKLNVEYNEKLSFWKATCPEGDYVTTYSDSDDITTYYGGKEALEEKHRKERAEFERAESERSKNNQ